LFTTVSVVLRNVAAARTWVQSAPVLLRKYASEWCMNYIERILRT